MIPDVSKALSWLEAHPQILAGIQRGIERETLRVTADGHLALTPHPSELGSALTNKWITTDFAEALLEFITPVDKDIDHLMAVLHDIHRYAARKLGKELMWPLSMPCFIDAEQQIELAQYGASNAGRLKTLYREGLKNRYSALMQTISGVHYNFSLPLSFWQAKEGVVDEIEGKDKISNGYFRLIRNYYRFGWVIPFLFGASPVVCSSFIKGRETDLSFEKLDNGGIYLPYATTLRMSDLGYTNKAQRSLDITFNNLETYVAGLKKATRTPSEEFAKIGVKKDGKYQQLNANVLQIENEFYAPIRPKRVVKKDETASDALLRGGVEYIEVRSLDVNPFSPVGIDEEQARFLDLFLIWCALAEAPEMSSEELQCTQYNWGRVILEGRKPGQTIGIGCDSVREPLDKVGKSLFADLLRVAEVLDSQNNNDYYQQVCNKLVVAFDDPELTLSGRMLQSVKGMGLDAFGLSLAEHYRQRLTSEPMQVISEEQFAEEAQRSIERQIEIEKSDTVDFESYLASILE